MEPTLKPLPPDPLLSIMADFAADARPDKIDLGVGVYKDEAAATPIMSAVREAARRLAEIEDSKAYQGPAGWPGFAQAARPLVTGAEDSFGARFVAAPTIGSSGALRLVGDLLLRMRPGQTIWLPDPSWANHAPIFSAAGLRVAWLPYYEPGAREISRDAFFAALEAVGEGEAALFHGCCHNPTGADLAGEDWARAGDIIRQRRVMPVIDIAYHGLGRGLDEDARGWRDLLQSAPRAFVTYTFSKNMGLYRERVGFAGYLGESEREAGAVLTHLYEAARTNYSMPPSHGEALAQTVLSDEALLRAWREELSHMRTRIEGLRKALATALQARAETRAFAFIEDHLGMFSRLPLEPSHIDALRKRHGVYAAPDGRINLSGLPEGRIEAFADALRETLR